jgi:hypothetical protein
MDGPRGDDPAAVRVLVVAPPWQVDGLPLRPAQELEILLTVLQTGVGVMLLANMKFDWLDATIIFVLWLAQFIRPGLREEVAVAYGLWMVILAVGFVVRGNALLAPRYFWDVVRRRTP